MRAFLLLRSACGCWRCRFGAQIPNPVLEMVLALGELAEILQREGLEERLNSWTVTCWVGQGGPGLGALKVRAISQVRKRDVENRFADGAGGCFGGTRAAKMSSAFFRSKGTGAGRSSP